MKRIIMALTIAAMGLFYAGSAGAFTQTTLGTMNVTGTMVAACTVSTAPLDFGTFKTTGDTLANTTITVNCSNGTPYRIDIDAGVNYYFADIYRYLKRGTAPADATNVVPYTLYIDNGLMTIWGDNGVTFCPTCPSTYTGKLATGTGANDIHTVYGRAVMPINGPGAYSDTLTVTVNY